MQEFKRHEIKTPKIKPLNTRDLETYYIRFCFLKVLKNKPIHITVTEYIKTISKGGIIISGVKYYRSVSYLRNLYYEKK